MKSAKLVDDTATDTLPKLLRRNMQRFGKQTGMREKDRGIWQSYSWRECHAHVRDFALGLAAAGFKRGDKLSVLGDNRARLYWAQLAAQALGGMSVPLYQDSIASELAYVLEHAEVSVVVAEDQEQVDKVLSIADKLPNLRLVAYEDPRGMNAYEHGILKSFDDLEATGAVFGKEHPGFFEREVDQGRADDIAAIAYTSGTTGRSKGVLLQPRQHDRDSGEFRRRRAAEARRQLAVLPADGLGRRHDVFARHQHGVRCRLQLPREPRDGAARPARAGADHVPGAAAHLGEHADGLAGPGGGRLLAQAEGVRAFPRACRAVRAAQDRRQADPGDGRGSATGWASSSSTGRCAISSACATRARA